METGNKFLQVKYTIDSSPPELDPSKTVKEKNDKSNNSDTGDDGERNNEENQQQHVSSTVLLDSIPRHSSGEPTYEFCEYSNYSEDDVLEGWSPLMMTLQLSSRKHIAIGKIALTLISMMTIMLIS